MATILHYKLDKHGGHNFLPILHKDNKLFRPIPDVERYQQLALAQAFQTREETSSHAGNIVPDSCNYS
jgi:hypothetical protein